MLPSSLRKAYWSIDCIAASDLESTERTWKYVEENNSEMRKESDKPKEFVLCAAALLA